MEIHRLVIIFKSFNVFCCWIDFSWPNLKILAAIQAADTRVALQEVQDSASAQASATTCPLGPMATTASPVVFKCSGPSRLVVVGLGRSFICEHFYFTVSCCNCFIPHCPLHILPSALVFQAFNPFRFRSALRGRSWLVSNSWKLVA